MWFSSNNRSTFGLGIMEVTGDGLTSMAQEEVGRSRIYYGMPEAENLGYLGTNGRKRVAGRRLGTPL